MRIYLVRHGKQQSKLCNDNTNLCDVGIRQAELTGNRLLKYKIDSIYSSDLLRAVETAHIINNQIEQEMGSRLPHEIRQGLRECDFGELTGLEDETMKEKYKEFMESRFAANGDWAYPNGESGKNVVSRFMPVLKEVASSGEKNVVMVTHGGAIRCILMELLKGEQSKRLFLGKYFERGSITELYYDKKKKRFFLERFNDYAHLEGEPGLLMRRN